MGAKRWRLRGALISQGIEPGDIDPVLQQIEALALAGAAADVEQQQAALRALMQLEYRLRQRLEMHEFPELLLSGSGEIPQEYRAMVADYFRNLSRDPAR